MQFTDWEYKIEVKLLKLKKNINFYLKMTWNFLDAIIHLLAVIELQPAARNGIKN